LDEALHDGIVPAPPPHVNARRIRLAAGGADGEFRTGGGALLARDVWPQVNRVDWRESGGGSAVIRWVDLSEVGEGRVPVRERSSARRSVMCVAYVV
jgi:hypothetical protein